jgi:hypothetical protein
MVPPLRLLEALEVGVEVLLRVERGAVDARQLRLRRVAAPVRAREPGQLQGLDRTGVLQVRPTAEVGEVPLRVQRDRALGAVDELDLVGLVLLLEPRPGVVARDLLPRPFAAFLELPLDLLLDPLEVVLLDRVREVEVVVEAVVDRRADRDLDARVQAAHGLGEQVRGRVPQHRERVRVAPVARGEDLDRLAVVERQPEVLHTPVRAYEHRLLGEPRPDRARCVEPGRTVRKFELRVVGKDDLHGGRHYAPPRR